MSDFRKAREAAGFTRQAVSEILGIPIRTLEDWEATKRVPPSYTEKMLMDFYEQQAGEQLFANMRGAEMDPKEAIKLEEKVEKIKSLPKIVNNTKEGFMASLENQIEFGASAARRKTKKLLGAIAEITLPELTGGWEYWFDIKFNVIIQREYWNKALDCISFEYSDIKINVFKK